MAVLAGVDGAAAVGGGAVLEEGTVAEKAAAGIETLKKTADKKNMPNIRREGVLRL
jgi:hypothetical protein